MSAFPHLELDLEVGVLLTPAGLCSHAGSKEGWTGLCHGAERDHGISGLGRV